MAECTFVDGTVSAVAAGQGPTLVLFHSLLADRSSFDRVFGRLTERFRVVAMDLPGFGRSARVTGELAATADRMAEAVRGLAGDGMPMLLGNGFGGFVALTLAIRHPRLLSRLVLADCGAVFSEPGRAAFRAMAGAAAAKGLLAVADTAMRRLFAPDFQAANPELIEDRRRRFLAMDPAVFGQACDSLARLDLRADLGRVDAPALVAVGEHDEATPPEMSKALAAGLPRAALRVIAGCAHVPQLQDPEGFLEVIEPFLAGRGGH